MVFTTGQSSGSAIGLNLQTHLYVGGVDQSTVRVSPDVAVDQGFTGCISQVTYLLSSVHSVPLVTFLLHTVFLNEQINDDDDDCDDSQFAKRYFKFVTPYITHRRVLFCMASCSVFVYGFVYLSACPKQRSRVQILSPCTELIQIT